MKKWIIFGCLFLFGSGINLIDGQESAYKNFFAPADTLHKGRYYTLLGGTTIGYAATMIGLNAAWYNQFDRGPFHFFNDWGEWNDMDKVGHFYSAYNESLLLMYGGLWAGMERRKAMWLGVGFGTLFQTSIEVMDGFSEKWGFSVGDLAFNTGGIGLLLAQELAWEEQRIVLKFSAHPRSYSDAPIGAENGNGFSSQQQRADDLYGAKYYETFLKDYNGQTIWLSANIHSFIKNKNTRFPKWLNVAVGYGAANMLGGFGNEWEEDGLLYSIDEESFTRRRQLYLSLDIDFTKIKTKSPLVKGLLICLNALKFPAPALEWNSGGGGFRGYAFYW